MREPRDAGRRRAERGKGPAVGKRRTECDNVESRPNEQAGSSENHGKRPEGKGRRPARENGPQRRRGRDAGRDTNCQGKPNGEAEGGAKGCQRRHGRARRKGRQPAGKCTNRRSHRGGRSRGATWEAGEDRAQGVTGHRGRGAGPARRGKTQTSAREKEVRKQNRKRKHSDGWRAEAGAGRLRNRQERA